MTSTRRGCPARLFEPLVFCLCAAGLCVGAAVASAAPAVDFVGKPVLAVTLESGGRTIDDPATLRLVATPVGQPLSLEQVRETVVHLYSLGRFRDVHVDATTQAHGVALRYVLYPLRVIRRVTFRGDLGVPVNRLRELVTDRYGRTPPAGRAQDAARALEDAYRDWGYLGARVSTHLVEAGADVALVFDVATGPRARIGGITVEGKALMAADPLLGRLGIRPGDPYDREDIERRLRSYADALRARNYYEASTDHTIRPRDNGRIVDLTLTVEAGPHVIVRFEGDPLPLDRRDELAPIAGEGSVDEDLLEDSTRRIEEYLRSQGYWRANAEFERRSDDGNLVIAFRVMRGRQYHVARLELTGNATVPSAVLRQLIRTAASDPFVEARFVADVAALEDYYRRLGYTEALVEPAMEDLGPATDRGDAQVALLLAMTEGPRTVIGSLAFQGNDSIAAARLSRVISSVSGGPFDERRLAIDREALLTEYFNQGYQTASLDVVTEFEPDRTLANVTFRVREGSQVLVDDIIIVGNTRTRASVILRELTLAPGAPLGADDIVESQRRLSTLGLFRRVRISELRHDAGDRRDLVVTVEEAPATSIGYGGGLEAGQRLRRGTEETVTAVERLELAPRGFFEIGRRNLWGKNRAVDLFTRVSLRPRDDPEDPAEGGFGFNEYRILGTYREPRLFGSEVDLFVTTFFEQSIRSSFNLNTRGVLAEFRRRIAPRASLSGRYSYNRNRLFDEQIEPEDRVLIDRLFPEVSLSTFSATLFRDTRDEPFDPDRGTQIEIDTEVAGRAVGSQVGYAKTLIQGFLYRRLPGSRRVVFAAGSRLGLATGFPREVALPELASDGSTTVAVVREIPASVRFFAGGDTTVRGFALDRLGDEATIDQTGFPKGGQALVIFNTELRVHVWRDLGAVAFLDAGNVFARVGDLDLTNIRGGAGFGLRYQSPIGPIRVDLGFKLDRRELRRGERERPTAIHISIGQAF